MWRLVLYCAHIISEKGIAIVRWQRKIVGLF